MYFGEATSLGDAACGNLLAIVCGLGKARAHVRLAWEAYFLGCNVRAAVNLCLLALRTSARHPAVTGALETVSCHPWHPELVDDKRFENNVWGIHKSRGPTEQCIIKEGSNLGWQWEYGGCDLSVMAYPQAVIGAKVRRGPASYVSTLVRKALAHVSHAC